ncbi:hypothetical protein [Caldivirga sp.]|uniref:hypothetical protein n=1 Tax=Caldivirga sp. TaxID=2080243 RepID=UPI003D0EBFBA
MPGTDEYILNFLRGLAGVVRSKIESYIVRLKFITPKAPRNVPHPSPLNSTTGGGFARDGLG